MKLTDNNFQALQDLKKLNTNTTLEVNGLDTLDDLIKDLLQLRDTIISLKLKAKTPATIALVKRGHQRWHRLQLQGLNYP